MQGTLCILQTHMDQQATMIRLLLYINVLCHVIFSTTIIWLYLKSFTRYQFVISYAPQLQFLVSWNCLWSTFFFPSHHTQDSCSTKRFILKQYILLLLLLMLLSLR